MNRTNPCLHSFVIPPIVDFTIPINAHYLNNMWKAESECVGVARILKPH